jgi:hypothetical protein
MKPFIAPEPFELTLSFKRDPGEHVDVMMAAGKRFQSPANGDSALHSYWLAIIAVAALIGIAMELHRRFLLPYLFGDSVFPTFSKAMGYFSPLILLALFFRLVLTLYVARIRRVRMMRRMRSDDIVDVDVSRSGIKFTMDDSILFVEWKAFKTMSIIDNRIDIDTAGFTVYIPERAFADRAAFLEGCKTIRRLWRDGVDPARSSG